MPIKRQSSFLRAVQETQKSQSDRETITSLQSDAGTQTHSIMAKKGEKITFYLTTEQANKLDDLVYEYKKRTNRRVNRNDIVRYLIEQCTIESLTEM